MPRYKFIVEYDGSPYVGWQRQINGWSVQGAIEAAITSICVQSVTLFGAGRTDTGVHALHQVAHVDIDRHFKPSIFGEAINAKLREAGERIAILDCVEVTTDFDARFSAKARHYCYRIINRQGHLGLDANRAWWIKKPLDIEAMDQAAKLLLGTHDFTTFRATQCQADSPIRTLDQLDVRRVPGGSERDGHTIEIITSARSFLHNQVRSMAGSLKKVGEGRWTANDLKAALDARDRKACGPVAPAHGLYFVGVDY
jgi:tRNA pseudouridine38-40 synthase